MRKILVILAVLLLAAPAWAAVSVNCTAVDPGNTYEVRVNYNCVGDNNDIRAFGIKIDVNNGAKISISDVNDSDYYIFPGSIDINSNGTVDGWGSAVVDHNTGANGSFILEMGSLYDPCDPIHKTTPPQSGTLCTFVTDKECVVGLSRDADRGGVVMEDGSDYATLSGCTLTYANCLSRSHGDWAEYDKFGRPDSWCYYSQCYGDADGTIHGSLKTGGFYHVGSPDMTALGLGWKKKYQDNVTPYEPNALNHLAADFDHTEHGSLKTGGFYRVGSPDMTILGVKWKLKCSDPCSADPNCGYEDCGGTEGERFVDKFWP